MSSLRDPWHQPWSSSPRILNAIDIGEALVSYFVFTPIHVCNGSLVLQSWNLRVKTILFSLWGLVSLIQLLIPWDGIAQVHLTFYFFSIVLNKFLRVFKVNPNFWDLVREGLITLKRRKPIFKSAFRRANQTIWREHVEATWLIQIFLWADLHLQLILYGLIDHLVLFIWYILRVSCFKAYIRVERRWH